jgi:SAM-dependent methyltransferase
MSDEELSAYYTDEYVAKYIVLPWLQRTAQRWKLLSEARHLRSLFPREHQPSVFEAGAGCGNFLSVARDAGFAVAGCEPSAPARETAQSAFGLRLQPRTIAEMSFDQRHDVVVARHVIEHLVDARVSLENLFSNGLKSGGVLFLKLPVIDSWEPRAFGKYWSGWDAPRHRLHFTSGGIRKLLTQIGFSGITVQREVVPMECIYSMTSALGGRRQLLGRLFAALPGRTIAAQVVSLLLSPLGAGRMTIIARK